MKKNHKNNTNSDRNKTMNEASEAGDIEEGIDTVTLTQDTDAIESKEQESVNTKETTDEKESNKDKTDPIEEISKNTKENRDNKESNEDTTEEDRVDFRKLCHDIIADLWIQYYGKTENQPNSLLHLLNHTKLNIDVKHRMILLKDQGKIQQKYNTYKKEHILRILILYLSQGSSLMDTDHMQRKK